MVTPKKRFRRRNWIARFGSSKFYQTLRPILIGIVHGLAGSAAVALLVLPIIRDPSLGDGLSVDLRRRNNRRHDADHGRHRGAGFVFARGFSCCIVISEPPPA